MTRKLAFLAGILATLSVGHALAADVAPRFEKAPVYGVPIRSWTGLYVGVNVGGAVGTASLTASGGSFDANGWIYGAQLGYLYQTGRIVLGLEGDIQGARIRGRTAPIGTPCAGLGCDVGVQDWLSTLRGRAGVAVDSFMPYVTGGFAFGNMRARNNNLLGGVSGVQTGYALGAGLEFPIAGNWTGRGEYLFVDLGDFACPAASCGGAGPSRASVSTNLYRAAINYRF